MDVNGTRFHLLLTEDDWQAGTGQSGARQESDLVWDREHASLCLGPLPYIFPTMPGDDPPLVENRRGADRDQYGNWYWISENRIEIYILGAGTRKPKHFWSAKDQEPPCEPGGKHGDFCPGQTPQAVVMSLSALAVTEHHYLVVGVMDPPGFLIFDLHAGGPPIQKQLPPEFGFTPFDMAPAPGGGVWVLDRKARYCWKMDRHLRLFFDDHPPEPRYSHAHGDFQPTEPSLDRPAIQASADSPGYRFQLSPDVRDPVSIESLPDGSALILDNNPAAVTSNVYRCRPGKEIEKCTPFIRSHRLRGHDMAFVSTGDKNGVEGALFIVDSNGNQTFLFQLQAKEEKFSLEFEGKYYPMRLFTGKGLVASQNMLFYDSHDRWVPLVEHYRSQYNTEGSLETRIFDGKEHDCVWHRLFIDACIPPETKIRIQTKTANEADLLENEEFKDWTPDPYCRSDGSELPYHRPFLYNGKNSEGTGTWELLFQKERGRFLQLKLTMTGTGGKTPRIRALRIYYPRFSYLKKYLPGIYDSSVYETKEEGPFLERFLANFEGFYTAMEDKIDQGRMLFDVRATPPEYLQWLASWFGVIMDPAWEEWRRRLFLAHAMELFNQRGTPAGLIRAIRLWIDSSPDHRLFQEDVVESITRRPESNNTTPIPGHGVRIVEQFLTRKFSGLDYHAGTSETPKWIVDADKWMPEQGVARLHRKYRKFLEEKYKVVSKLVEAWKEEYNSFEDIVFPPVMPCDDQVSMDWREFITQCIGFTYETVEYCSRDRRIFQNFLARRYQYEDRLNQAWQTGGNGYNDFETIDLPGKNDMPAGGIRLSDWLQFVSFVVPVSRNAHRFVVLVPVDPEQTWEERVQKLDIVRRIVQIEKPAHTSCDVKEYWDLFQVGRARLELDTALGQGSRFEPITLGEHCLADGFLAGRHPWNVTDRMVVGRDPIDRKMNVSD